MEKFIVSARKYRPARFDEVVGQQSVTVTLKNAIRQKKLAHAFLFCGPRGVGKTTCARILAKTINCENPTEDFEACGKCSSCISLSENSSLNIFEMDAASNSHVEDIRNLIEQVRYAPQNGRYKIYIIDEIHMLSSSAFNAFLKTLEEPPAYTKFILATTEKHKILPTILSRCQIFDFNRISIDDIVQHLEEICQKEEIEYEADALHLIAQKADGGLRDALSIFDRMASFGDRNINFKQVAENLNILDHEFYFNITEHLAEGDTSELLLIYSDILKKGFEGDLFLNGLTEHFRNLLVAGTDKTLSLLQTAGKLKERYIQQSGQVHPAFLLNWANLANKAEFEYRDSKNKRLHVELALLKMASLHSMFSITADSTDTMQKKKPETDNLGETKNDYSGKEPEPKSVKEEDNTQSYENKNKPEKETVHIRKDKINELKSIGIDKIKDYKNEENQSEEPKTTLSEPAESLSQNETPATKDLTADKLWEIWKQMAESSNKPSLSNTYNRENLSISIDDSKLILETATENTIKSNEDYIIKAFRKETQIDNLVMIIKKIEKTSTFAENKPFTNEDKLHFFIQKKPEMKLLMEKLNLRLEY
ncbi:MAG: DNA polymerase III subunit gamma/tau [Chitinophagaceae bacterium]|nr:MAG: DNA polymerase III subunit gamma/tau [Chitinophagaceae bacterium]